MTKKSVDWKRRAEAVFAPLRAIDRSWLPRSLQQNARLLDAAMLRQTTRRIIYKYLPVGDRAMFDAESAVPKWAQQGVVAQRRAVLRLGAHACSTPLRRTVEQSELGSLRHVIDEETYREALTQDAALIRNNVNDAFRQAMLAGDVLHFVAAMGLSVLQSVMPQDELFIRQSLRYLFSTRAWSLRRPDLVCDSAQVIKVLNQSGDG